MEETTFYDELIEDEEFPVKSDKRLVRRKRTAHKKDKDARRAKEHVGSHFFSEEKGRVLPIERPDFSKAVKKIAARKARHSNVGICGRANYRRVYDFWWELT